MITIALQGVGTGTLLAMSTVSSRPDAPILLMVAVDRQYYVCRAVDLFPEEPRDLPTFEHRGPLLSYYSRCDAETSYEIDRGAYESAGWLALS